MKVETAEFKLFYHGVGRKKTAAGVVPKEEFVRNVVEIIRASDRVMCLKVEVEVLMLSMVLFHRGERENLEGSR